MRADKSRDENASPGVPMHGEAAQKRNTKGLFLITTGLLLIAAALLLVLYNLRENDRAGRASAEIVKKLEETIDNDGPDALKDDGADQDAAGTGAEQGQELPTVEIDGYQYIGILEIPCLSLKLPVMAEWDYERLKISPCRYSGSCYLDDMVICAHNYAKHFSPVKWLEIGEEVYFITVDGRVNRYQVSNRETVQPTAVEEMIDNTREAWDLTLFTCNTSGLTRCAVRCERIPH
ncbi:MAG: sortase [Lachnospiraceae bacterium]|nr:sortase [Lachnospiraceae bacterium]